MSNNRNGNNSGNSSHDNDNVDRNNGVNNEEKNNGKMSTCSKREVALGSDTDGMSLSSRSRSMGAETGETYIHTFIKKGHSYVCILSHVQISNPVIDVLTRNHHPLLTFLCVYSFVMTKLFYEDAHCSLEDINAELERITLRESELKSTASDGAIDQLIGTMRHNQILDAGTQFVCYTAVRIFMQCRCSI